MRVNGGKMNTAKVSRITAIGIAVCVIASVCLFTGCAPMGDALMARGTPGGIVIGAMLGGGQHPIQPQPAPPPIQQPPASASFLGTLVHTENIITITGKLAWRCTYSVGGNNTTVILQEMCPCSMRFQ